MLEHFFRYGAQSPGEPGPGAGPAIGGPAQTSWRGGPDRPPCPPRGAVSWRWRRASAIACLSAGRSLVPADALGEALGAGAPATIWLAATVARRTAAREAAVARMGYRMAVPAQWYWILAAHRRDDRAVAASAAQRFTRSVHAPEGEYPVVVDMA